jgi:hypothetical protein
MPVDQISLTFKKSLSSRVSKSSIQSADHAPELTLGVFQKSVSGPRRAR